MPKFVETLRRNRKVIGLFALMVLLPAGVFGILIVRAFRGEQVRLDYETRLRQQQIIQLTQADLANWLFSAAPGGAPSLACCDSSCRRTRSSFLTFSWRCRQTQTRG